LLTYHSLVNNDYITLHNLHNNQPKQHTLSISKLQSVLHCCKHSTMTAIQWKVITAKIWTKWKCNRNKTSSTPRTFKHASL